MLFFIAICLGNQVSGVPGQDDKNELFEKLDLFATVLAIIQHSYVEKVTSKDLIYGALEGTLSSLDPHSQFLKPALYDEIQIDTGGEFGGLGVEVVIRDDVLVVISALPDTPAEHAGFQAGDKIIKINGEVLESPKLDQIVKKLRGPVGSKVEITIYRHSTRQYFSVELIREKIKIQSVLKTQVLPETSTGYIKITKFQESTSSELETALKNLIQNNITSLILDLRNNPGGLLEEGINVAGLLCGPDKLIVSTKGRLPEQNVRKISKDHAFHFQLPLIILINHGSASSSEIVAGAVQDYKRGKTLGISSFGKASVQSLIPLKDGSAVRLTTARYYTPNDRLIHGKGIQPDIEVKLVKADYVKYAEILKQMKDGEMDKNFVFQDTQITHAINYFTQKKSVQDTSKTKDSDRQNETTPQK